MPRPFLAWAFDKALSHGHHYSRLPDWYTDTRTHFTSAGYSLRSAPQTYLTAMPCGGPAWRSIMLG